MTDKDLLQQALEKLEFFERMRGVSEDTRRLITALRERLAQNAARTTDRGPEVLHLQAAEYANRRKREYLDYLKTGLAKEIGKEMVEWVWMAHYEGYRDGMKGANHER